MHVMGFDLPGRAWTAFSSTSTATMWQLGRKKLDHPNHHYVAAAGKRKSQQSRERRCCFTTTTRKPSSSHHWSSTRLGQQHKMRDIQPLESFAAQRTKIRVYFSALKVLASKQTLWLTLTTLTLFSSLHSLKEFSTVVLLLAFSSWISSLLQLAFFH